MEKLGSFENHGRPERRPTLIAEMHEVLDEHLDIEKVDDTYEIEGDTFSLTFTQSDEILEIRSIDVRGNSGRGTEVVECIHAYADEHGLEVIASNVVDTAQGFWQKMGYQEGEEVGEYFRSE